MHKIKAREERARKRLAGDEVTNVEELRESKEANKTLEPEFV